MTRTTNIAAVTKYIEQIKVALSEQVQIDPKLIIQFYHSDDCDDYDTFSHFALINSDGIDVSNQHSQEVETLQHGIFALALSNLFEQIPHWVTNTEAVFHFKYAFVPTQPTEDGVQVDFVSFEVVKDLEYDNHEFSTSNRDIKEKWSWDDGTWVRSFVNPSDDRIPYAVSNNVGIHTRFEDAIAAAKYQYKHSGNEVEIRDNMGHLSYRISANDHYDYRAPFRLQLSEDGKNWLDIQNEPLYNNFDLANETMQSLSGLNYDKLTEQAPLITANGQVWEAGSYFVRVWSEQIGKPLGRVLPRWAWKETKLKHLRGKVNPETLTEFDLTQPYITYALGNHLIRLAEWTELREWIYFWWGEKSHQATLENAPEGDRRIMLVEVRNERGEVLTRLTNSEVYAKVVAEGKALDGYDQLAVSHLLGDIWDDTVEHFANLIAGEDYPIMYDLSHKPRFPDIAELRLYGTSPITSTYI